MSLYSSTYSLILGDLQHTCGDYAEYCKELGKSKKHTPILVASELAFNADRKVVFTSRQRCHAHPQEDVWDALFGISGGLSGWYKNVCSASDPCNPLSACQLRSCWAPYPNTLADAQLCSCGNMRGVVELLCCVSCADGLLLLITCWSKPATCRILSSFCCNQPNAIVTNKYPLTLQNP